jgi:hypothetical protein
MLVLIFSWENLAGQIKHGQRARDANGFASSEDREVPTAEQPNKPKPTSNPQQHVDVLDVGFGLGVWDWEVGGGDEREEHHETEERESEEEVDAYGADEEDEAADDPVLMSDFGYG